MGRVSKILNTLRFLQRNLLFLSQEMMKPEGAFTKMYEGYVLMRLEGRDVEGKFQNHRPGSKVGAMTGRSAQERAPAQLRCRSLHQASPRNITPCNTEMDPSIQKLSHAFRCRCWSERMVCIAEGGGHSFNEGGGGESTVARGCINTKIRDSIRSRLNAALNEKTNFVISIRSLPFKLIYHNLKSHRV